MRSYEVVHLGLGKFGIVALIVAVPSVTHHVYVYIGMKLLPVLRGKFRCKNNSLRIVAVDVKNRCLYQSRRCCAIGGRSGIVKIGGKADLVVNYKVDGTSGFVSWQLTHLYRFINYALSGCCCISVYGDGKDLAVIVVQQVYFGPCKSFKDWVYCFQV